MLDMQPIYASFPPRHYVMHSTCAHLEGPNDRHARLAWTGQTNFRPALEKIEFDHAASPTELRFQERPCLP